MRSIGAMNHDRRRYFGEIQGVFYQGKLRWFLRSKKFFATQKYLKSILKENDKIKQKIKLSEFTQSRTNHLAC